MNELKPLHKFYIFILLIVFITLPFFIFHNKSKTKDSSPIENIDVAQLEKYYSSNPNTANTINLSLAYINNKMPGKADFILSKYIQIDSTNSIVYNNLGVANNLLRNYPQAIAACNKAIQLKPDFELAKNNLKWALLEVAAIRKNIDSLLKNKDPKTAVQMPLQLGLNYLQIGAYDSSIIYFQKGALLHPKDETYPTNIGTACMLKNEADKAIPYFKKALELNPANQLCVNNLNWAKQVLQAQQQKAKE